MKTDMSSKERILTTINGEETDHVPLSMEVHPSYALYDPTIADWRDQFERTDFLLRYGVDPMVEIWLPDPCCHPDVRIKTWREQRDGLVLLVKEYDTPAGTLRQVIRETEDLYTWHKINRNTTGTIAELVDGVGLMEDVNPSRSVEFLIKGPEDLPKMRFLFHPPMGEELRKWREAAAYARAQAEQRQTICLARRTYAGSAVLWLTDATATMLAYDTDPGYISEFLAIIQSWQLQLLEMVLDVGVDIVTRFGYYDTPDFWGRKYFSRFLEPLLEREAAICEQAGCFLSQQQSKGVSQLVDIYKRMRVHILRDLDPVQGGEDMALLKRELGGTKTLMGGINCDVRLAGASQAEIEQLVADTLDLMAPGGRFILHPVPGVYAGVPWRKVEWLMEAWKNHA